ncbi:MAG: CpcT/CpeT family chromophore lyase [Salinivirgaceae bacterium]
MNYLTVKSLSRFSLIAALLTSTILAKTCKEDEEDSPNKKPTIELITPEASAQFIEGDTIHLSCTATDPEEGNLPDENITWESSTDGTIGHGTLLETTTLTANTHTITVKATDSQGLMSSDSVSITVLDDEKPTVTITSPNNNYTMPFGSTISLQCSANDLEDGELTGESIIWRSTIEGQLGNGTSLENIELTPGNHTITAIATDSKNNQDSASISVNALENSVPTIAIVIPDNNSEHVFTDAITFTCEASDTEDIQIEADQITWRSNIDGEMASGVSITTNELSANTHTIYATVVDSHGANSTDSIQIIVSPNNAPEIQITSPENAAIFTENTPINFSCSVSDTEDQSIANEHVLWNSSIDGQMGSGQSFEYSSLTIGEHTIVVTATDTHGATTADSITITIEEAPEITLELMVEWMTGSFSSEEQAATSSDPYHYDVRRKVAQIWTNNRNGYWVYLEQAYADDQNNPYFQRIYHFYMEDGVIKNTIYGFENPSNYVGSWETPEDFDNLDETNLIEKPNCGLTFQIESDHVFGETSGTDCGSSIPNVAYMTSEQWIYANEWHSYDLGYNSSGVVVMGPYSPYIFDKIENFD